MLYLLEIFIIYIFKIFKQTLQVNSGGVARATGALALEALRNSPDALASLARPPRPLVPVPVHQTVAKATVDVNGNASRAARSRHEGFVL